jgi:predicted neutral ceramidase superfamily lipid hydrolase
MSASQTMRARRFIVVAFCMTLAAVGLAFLVFSFPDTRPPTFFESICTWVWVAVSWPLCIYSAFTPHQDPPLAVFILLAFASGLFWAFIIELLIRARRRYVA